MSPKIRASTRLAAISGIGSLTLILAASCGRSTRAVPEIEGKLPVFPVSGKLTLDGQPMAGAFVMFYPLRRLPDDAAKNQPHAKVDEDGNFRLSTYGDGDGAPAGKYRVTVSWKTTDDSYSSEQISELPDKAPPRYIDSRTSRLFAEVKEEETSLPEWDLGELDRKQAANNQ